MSILQHWFRWGPVEEGDETRNDDEDDPTNTSVSSIGRSSSTSSGEDDERAQRWLTQFPPYGSNKASFDFLEDEVGGGDDAPTSQQQHENNLSSHQNNGTTPYFINNNASNNGDWPTDDEEAHLWKITAPTTPTSARAQKQQQYQQQHRLIVEQDMDEATFVGTPISPRGDSNSNSNAVVVVVDESKQHWMPDQLCKQCYNCESTFTFYRRRHHCRLCGQVFCNVCSGYFIKKSGGNITLRSCRLCYEQLQQQPPTVTAQTQPTQQQQQQQQANNIKSPETPTPVSPLPVNAVKAEEATNNNKLAPSSLALPLLYNTSLQTQLALQHGVQQPLLPQYVDNTDLHSPHEESSDTIPLTTDLPQQQQSSEGAFVPSANEASDPSLSSSAIVVAEQQSVPTTTRRSIMTTTSAAATSLSTALTEYQEQEKQMGNRHLGLTAACHLETLAESLLETDAPLLWNKATPVQRRRWISALMTHATKCCATVNPQVKKGDSLDLRPYCKIKGKKPTVLS
jgi:1-phosphatidylinositol-3-phosphate 5-kinase